MATLQPKDFKKTAASGKYAGNTRHQIILEKIKIRNLEHHRIEDNIKLQEVELSYRLIESPINGMIGRIHRFKGEYVEDGNTILTLHNPEVFWIEAYVDESQIRHVIKGKSVRLFWIFLAFAFLSVITLSISAYYFNIISFAYTYVILMIILFTFLYIKIKI